MLDELFTSHVKNSVQQARHQVQINGTLADEFKAHEGIRQEDPLPPYLYNIWGEVLSQEVFELHSQKRFDSPRYAPCGTQVPLLGRRSIGERANSYKTTRHSWHYETFLEQQHAITQSI